MNAKTIKILINFLSIIAILFGGAGMLISATYFWPAKIEDVIGAGFGFVGGCVLFAAGLITLGLMHRGNK